MRIPPLTTDLGWSPFDTAAAAGPHWEEELPLFTTQVTKWLRLGKLCSRPGNSTQKPAGSCADPRALL